MERPAKRAKVEPDEEPHKESPILAIVKDQRQRRLKRWSTVRLRTMGRHWLDYAVDVLDLVEKDILMVVCSRVSKVSKEEVDVVAQLVGLSYRMGKENLGKRIFGTYKARFTSSGSPMCVLASSWPGVALVGVKPAVLHVLWECERRGRDMTTGLVVYRLYQSILKLTVGDDAKRVSYYHQLSINEAA